MQNMELQQSTSQLFRKESVGDIEFLTKDSFIQQFQEDIEQHYSIYEIKQQINNNETEKLNLQIKKMLMMGLFLGAAGPLIGFKILLKDALNQLGYRQIEEKVYHKIQSPLKHLSHFIHEFIDEFTFVGLKNVKNFIERNCNQLIQQRGLQKYYEENKQKQQKSNIFNNGKLNDTLKDIIQKEFEQFKNQKERVIPSFDHRKFSSCMLFRSQSMSMCQNQNSEDIEKQKVQQKIISDSFLNFSSDFIDLQSLKDELLEYNIIQIIQVFMADISKHRYLLDNSNIEKHIEAAQCEKYKPSMDLIFESDEDKPEQNQHENTSFSGSNSNDNSFNNDPQDQFKIFDTLDDSDNEEEKDEEYEQDLKNLREHIQNLLKIIIQSFEVKAFQKICKSQFDKHCKIMVSSIQQDDNFHSNHVNFLNSLIKKVYYFERRCSYMSKIQSLVKQMISGYNCYIDFSEKLKHKSSDMEKDILQYNNKLQQQYSNEQKSPQSQYNIKQKQSSSSQLDIDNKYYYNSDDYNISSEDISTTDYEFNMNDIDYGEEIFSNQQNAWLYL